MTKAEQNALRWRSPRDPIGAPVRPHTVSWLGQAILKLELAAEQARNAGLSEHADQAWALRRAALAELAERYAEGRTVPPAMLRRIDALFGAQWRHEGDQ